MPESSVHAPALRISVVIATLGGGGAERLAVAVSDGLAARGHRVTLTTFTRDIAEEYDVPARVHRVHADVFGTPTGWFDALRARFRRHRVLRAALEAQTPDVVVSFVDVTNVRVLAAARRSRVPVIVSEETDPRVLPPTFGWRVLRRLLYSRAARVVVHTEGQRPMAERFARRSSRVAVIPNAVWIDRSAKATTERRSVVLAMGRLHSVKGFDTLVRAFALVDDAHPEWSLVVNGEGDERGRLESLVAELGLAERVRLEGRTDDPADALASASIFVVPSLSETFSLVLVEAMDAGLPIVATDLRPGPAELLEDGVDALLVPVGDHVELARALARLMDEPSLRTTMGAAARETAAAFGAERVAGLWEELLRAVTASAPRRRA